jgi:hypothetical protein
MEIEERIQTRQVDKDVALTDRQRNGVVRLLYAQL